MRKYKFLYKNRKQSYAEEIKDRKKRAFEEQREIWLLKFKNKGIRGFFAVE